jgi:hypothetical protein
MTATLSGCAGNAIERSVPVSRSKFLALHFFTRLARSERALIPGQEHSKRLPRRRATPDLLLAVLGRLALGGAVLAGSALARLASRFPKLSRTFSPSTNQTRRPSG